MSDAPGKTIASGFLPEPAWDVARLFPDQGAWSEEEYLALNGNHLVEFSHGYIEVLPMPTIPHQRMVAYLYGLLLTYVSTRRLGEVLFAPVRIRLWEGKFREPDVIFMLAGHAGRIGRQHWEGADLVMEVVSDDNRRHDLETKRREYARAGIPEYWIVDPLRGHILVLALEGASYALHGEFPRGTRAASRLLPGFEVDVNAVLAAGA